MYSKILSRLLVLGAAAAPLFAAANDCDRTCLKTSLDQLRQPYDQLLMKVLSLLQDSDPPLAREIVQSREAIWSILSDPEKFDDL